MSEVTPILLKLAELPAGEFCIVASHSMSEGEIAVSRACGYFYVSPDGIGWAIVRRTTGVKVCRRGNCPEGTCADATAYNLSPCGVVVPDHQTVCTPESKSK